MRHCSKAIIIIITILTLSVNISAQPYYNYTYSIDGKPQKEPDACKPVNIISGASLGITDLNEPSDIFVSKSNDKIFITDTKNNRIIVITKKFKFLEEISSFKNNGTKDTFDTPRGIFEASDGEIYIADSKKQRIVVLDKNYNLRKILLKPVSNLLSDSFEYIPTAVAVDDAKRVFIVSENVNQGIIELDNKGSFVGFFGPIVVSPKAADIFWKLIATKEQRQLLSQAVPTEYSNIDIDSEGFVYGTVSAIDTSEIIPQNFIRRLNPMGTDVLKRLGYTAPMGDVYYDTDKDNNPNISQLIDIAVLKYGKYMALDKRRGRIFSYTNQGELMFVFGGYGNDFGQFGTPAAIDSIDDKQFLVLDSTYNQIVCFELTDYGKIITNAVNDYYNRDLVSSAKNWTEALKHTSKSGLAFKGYGEALIRNKNYKEAMYYLEIAKDKTNYSLAFQAYRAQVIERYLKYILTLIVLLALAVFVYKRIRRLKNSNNQTNRALWRE